MGVVERWGGEGGEGNAGVHAVRQGCTLAGDGLGAGGVTPAGDMDGRGEVTAAVRWWER